MGILLAFMFLVNMFGAILLLPALAAYLVGDRLKADKPHGVEWGDVAPEDMGKVSGM
jgi:4-amino-4-deoxy-L-arabinose transferase-like glycosyltransferase